MKNFEEYREIIEIDDILEKEILKKKQDLFTANEIENFGKRLNSLACRKMLKESLMSALNIEDAYQEIEILSNEKGKPEITMSDALQMKLAEKGFKSVHCSLSHSFKTLATLLILDRN